MSSQRKHADLLFTVIIVFFLIFAVSMQTSAAIRQTPEGFDGERYLPLTTKSAFEKTREFMASWMLSGEIRGKKVVHAVHISEIPTGKAFVVSGDAMAVKATQQELFPGLQNTETLLTQLSGEIKGKKVVHAVHVSETPAEAWA
ncbi:uncharacterized protein A4U43_C10F13870 [Asparagus officinalis]|uniref:Uncharacterized protein n=1 Tax=Asparagus officinalis TaxID=4686 RepID=A0A5P1E2U7_ASPOF|nr:uncharacterized protein A4U43_C10F13870 [Asparagus officinalis]